MEVVGGVMIMLLLLALLFSAVWLSLPILIIVMGRRLERIAAQLQQIETRMSQLERRFVSQSAQSTSTDDKSDFQRN